MTVDRLLRRASSTPQLTATSSCPAPPLAPKNTSVVAVGRAPCAVSRRAAVRRMAPWKVSSAGGQVKNSFAPGAHRLQNQLGIGGERDGEDAGARRAGAQPLDASTSPTTRRRACRR